MIVLVFGIQGSGKSTLAHYIANKLGINYVSTGDILREVEKDQSEIGKKVHALMEKGIIIPDDITVASLEKYLKDNNIGNNFLLEGFPRTLNQVHLFNRQVDMVFEIVVSERVAIDRLKKRGRYDDVEDSIKTRMTLFKEKTVPVIDAYKKSQAKIFTINNERPLEEVQRELDDLLKN